jgi:hypothetical protein
MTHDPNLNGHSQNGKDEEVVKSSTTCCEFKCPSPVSFADCEVRGIYHEPCFGNVPSLVGFAYCKSMR